MDIVSYMGAIKQLAIGLMQVNTKLEYVHFIIDNNLIYHNENFPMNYYYQINPLCIKHKNDCLVCPNYRICYRDI